MQNDDLGGGFICVLVFYPGSSRMIQVDEHIYQNGLETTT